MPKKIKNEYISYFNSLCQNMKKLIEFFKNPYRKLIVINRTKEFFKIIKFNIFK
jgi:hypothetical protein